MTGSKITDRLKGENGVALEYTIGIPTDGTVDPTGEYPRRDNWFGNSVSAAARGVKVNGIDIGGSAFGVNFNVPLQSPSIFPFNQANETPSGHSFELDDTPGGERILIKHNTGAGVEMKADGSVVVVSKSNRIEVVGADHSVIVQGRGDVVYDGDMNLTVNGNYNLKVNGNYNIDVGANCNNSVHGTYITETGDVHSTVVRGNKDVKVYGDTVDFHVGERKIATKKDLRFITKNDFIVNSKRHVRFTAYEYLTASSGKVAVISSEDTRITGKKGRVGGKDFQFVGSNFSGEKKYNSDGKSEAMFEGYLFGTALESLTSEFSEKALYSWSSVVSSYASTAANANIANVGVLALGIGGSGVNLDIVPATVPDNPYDSFRSAGTPTVNIKYGFPDALFVNDGSVDYRGDDYIATPKWAEVWNKVSPFAVREVKVDEDNVLEDKISKSGRPGEKIGYSYYFKWTPDIGEIRSKLRTIDGANDVKTAPEMQTDGPKCISTLLDENRISPEYKIGAPPAPYEMKREASGSPSARFGYTLMGNPVERRSKTFTSKISSVSKTILADPLYNPDKHDAPINSSTKLSKSATVGKFLGAAGSRASLEFVPLITDRQDLARQWYLHAMLMEGVASSKQFANYRLQVTEGFYYPANGIREKFKGSGNRYWREPYRTEDGGGTQKSIVSGAITINQLKYEGRAVLYTVFNSRGKVDYGAGYDISLYIRDTFNFDQLSLDYDTARPDNVLGQQILIVMPKITKDYKATFEQSVCTYFNRQMLKSGSLVEITD
jgi:hypothetical protein